MENLNIATVRSYLEQGRSVCPFAKRCFIHYALDIDDMKPIISKFELGQAIVIVTSLQKYLTNFADTKIWAQNVFLKTMRHAARVTYPDVSDKEIAIEIATNIAPILRDDSNKARPNIALHNKPVITICLAPVYPVTHPRYSPIAILVLTWYEDLSNAGVFPKVRQAMIDEHGSVYDALELMLPLPDLRT